MDKKVIVSMATMPCRINRLKENLASILNQSYKFDKLVINVDDKNDVSENDLIYYNSIKNEIIEINICKNKWRSCNKLLPTLEKYPEDIIITIDDDIYYPIDSFKCLIEQYNKTPDCIIAHEVNPLIIENNYHIISINSNGKSYLKIEDTLNRDISNRILGCFIGCVCVSVAVICFLTLIKIKKY
jgi:hypothetical protein